MSDIHILKYFCFSVITIWLFHVFYEVIKRKFYLNRHRTWAVTIIDAILTLPQSLHFFPWSHSNDIYAIIKDAMLETKLTDFGTNNSSYLVQRFALVREVALEKLKAVYNPPGYYIIYLALKKRFITRLQFIEYMKLHPRIDEIQIKPPIFITGFPRTGTTFLHELLGLHESVRSHYSWEQLEPVPLTSSEDITDLERDRIRRYKSNRLIFDGMLYLIGDSIQSIHRIDYDEPEECTVPCGMDLPWGITELSFYIFSAKEYFECPFSSAVEGYTLYKRFLKLMEFQCKTRRNQEFTWMLKCPFHMPYLADLYEAFPGSTVVWTHRDPVECIASACSLYETLLCTFLEEYSIDRIMLGKAVLEYSKIAVTRAMQDLEKFSNRVKIVHVKYSDTINHPKDVCRDVCAKAGLFFNKNFEETLDDYLMINAKKREDLKSKKQQSTVHLYKPDDYGLTSESIREELKEYINRFDL